MPVAPAGALGVCVIGHLTRVTCKNHGHVQPRRSVQCGHVVADHMENSHNKSSQAVKGALHDRIGRLHAPTHPHPAKCTKQDERIKGTCVTYGQFFGVDNGGLVCAVET